MRISGQASGNGQCFRAGREKAMKTFIISSGLSITAPKPSVTFLKIGNGGIQILRREIRPEGIAEIELCISTLPQQEVTDPLFAAGANQQINRWCRSSGQALFNLFRLNRKRIQQDNPDIS